MNIRKKLNGNVAAAIVVTLLLQTPLCHADMFSGEFKFIPYFAFDAEFRHVNWVKAFGGNLFKRNVPEGDISLGLKLNPHFSIEGGYKCSVTKHRQVEINAETLVLGNLPVNPPEIYFSVLQFKGWHLGGTGYWPICWEDCLSLFGSVGLTHMKLFARSQLLVDVTGMASPPGANLRTFKKEKVIPFAGVGIQLALNDQTNLRFKLFWENTEKFRTISAPESTIFKLKIKNSIIYGVGFAVNFL